MAFRLPVAVRHLVVVATAVGMVGCTHSEVHRVARYRPGVHTVPVWSAAPASGVYAVRYAMVGESDVRVLGDSQRVVRKGQPLGFRVGPDGTLVAVAGAQEIPLPLRPEDVRKVVWHCRTEDSSQFAREVSKAGAGAVTLGATAGVVTGYAALGIGAAMLESSARDDCERPVRKHRKHRRRGPEAKTEAGRTESSAGVAE